MAKTYPEKNQIVKNTFAKSTTFREPRNCEHAMSASWTNCKFWLCRKS